MTEIDCDVAILHGWLNRVAKVALRDDFDVRGAAGKIDNCFPHATGGANEQNLDEREKSSMKFFCPFYTALFLGANEGKNSPWKKIRRYADNSTRANSHEGQRERIIAAQDREFVRQPRAQFAHALDIPASF